MYGYRTKLPPPSQEVNKLQQSQRFHSQFKWLLSIIIANIIIKVKLVYKRMLKASPGILLFAWTNTYLQGIIIFCDKYYLNISILNKIIFI